jgi:cation/acetate symporter
LGISSEGIGFIGMMINIVIALAVSSFYSKPPEHVYEMVDNIRRP